MYDRYDNLTTTDNNTAAGRSCYYDIFSTTDEVCSKFKSSYHSNTDPNKTFNNGNNFYETRCAYCEKISTKHVLYSDFELDTSILNMYVMCCNRHTQNNFHSSFSTNVCCKRKTLMRKRWKQCTTNLPDIYNNIKHSVGMGLFLSFFALLLPSGVSTLQPGVLRVSSSQSTSSVEIDRFITKEFNTDYTKDKDISRLVDRSEDMIRVQDEEESRVWPLESVAKRKIQNHPCPKPLIPDNGYILGKDYNSGSTVYIRCKSNYYLVGSSQMKCRTIHYLFKTIVKWDSTEQRYCKRYPLRRQVKPIYPYSLHTSRSQPILVFWGKSLPWRLYFSPDTTTSTIYALKKTSLQHNHNFYEIIVDFLLCIQTFIAEVQSDMIENSSICVS